MFIKLKKFFNSFINKNTYINICQNDFILKSLNNKLKSNKIYRIIDYKPIWFGENFIMAGNQFDILIRTLSSDEFDHNVHFIKHEGDEYFKNCDLSRWSGKICNIDLNDYTEIFITKKIKGMLYGSYVYNLNTKEGEYYKYLTKGDNQIPLILYSKDSILNSQSEVYEKKDNDFIKFIYKNLHLRKCKRGIIIDRLTDEFNNSCPYDFKNVLYLGSGLFPAGSGNTGPMGYTFSNKTSFFSWTDDTVTPFDPLNRTADNYITWKDSIMHLPCVLFGHVCIGNETGIGVNDCFIGDLCSFNTINENCKGIKITYNSYGNIITNSNDISFNYDESPSSYVCVLNCNKINIDKQLINSTLENCWNITIDEYTCDEEEGLKFFKNKYINKWSEIVSFWDTNHNIIQTKGDN